MCTSASGSPNSSATTCAMVVRVPEMSTGPMVTIGRPSPATVMCAAEVMEVPRQ